MITRKQQEQAQAHAARMCSDAGIVLLQTEREHIEIVDEGLGDLEHTGLQIVTYINTARVCAKEIILFPQQTCPEHSHPTVAERIGKEETFRCRWGTVYLYVPGIKTASPMAIPPAGTEQYYTAWHQIVLNPGEQYTIYPDTIHWFQAGSQGAVVSEFSTSSSDETDIFTNPNISRATVVAEDE